MPIYKYILIAFILVLSQDYAVSQDNQAEEYDLDLNYCGSVIFGDSWCYFQQIREVNNIKVNDTLSFLNENYFSNDKNINGISLGYEFNRDFRDIKNYPLDGFRLNFKIRTTAK